MHPDRLFPSSPEKRDIARRLFARIENLPIISPHGHTEARWFAENRPFPNATELLLVPDHYLYRMLFSRGIEFDDIGVPSAAGPPAQSDPRVSWRLFAENYHLFRGTPSRLWLDYVFANIFGLTEALAAETADEFFDAINQKLEDDEFLPRAMFDKFNIEILATTDSPLCSLEYHEVIRDSEWNGRIIPTYRPDPVVDPDDPDFRENIAKLGELNNEDVATWKGYLNAHRARREFFKAAGATATDHGHPTARTADLSTGEAERLFARVLRNDIGAEDAETFRAQMLTEMAAMSIDDGLVMQIHPGSVRSHNASILESFGRDRGFDIPQRTEYVREMKPLLDKFGLDKRLSMIVFTLDESSYSRELAPLAGVYPTLKLGPAWWFHDAPDGMKRFRQLTTETAGFYNTVGFNDDTRAFLSIPARHDVARRVDCAFLAELVSDHRLEEDEASEVARQLAYELPKSAYKLDIG